MTAPDSLTAVVLDALSSRYCPTNARDFLLKVALVAAVLCCIAAALFFARTRFANSISRFVAATAAALLLLFALGGASWYLFGVSGCSIHAAVRL